MNVAEKLIRKAVKESSDDPSDLIDFGDAWASLGSSVSSQVKNVLGDSDYDANPNAIKQAIQRLKYTDLASSIVEYLEEWMIERTGSKR